MKRTLQEGLQCKRWIVPVPYDDLTCGIPPLSKLTPKMSSIQDKKQAIMDGHESGESDSRNDIPSLCPSLGGESEASKLSDETKFIAHSPSDEGHVSDMCPATPCTRA